MTNKNKKNFLKNFLTTTSALAVITGASNSTMGAQFKTDNVGAVVLEDGQPVVNAILQGGGGGNWAVNDSFYWDGHAAT